MNKKLITLLKGLGLDDKESKVYLACLELGKASVTQISKKSGLKRTTVYHIVNPLLNRGLLSKLEDDKSQKFLAESPEKLLTMLKDREKEILKCMPDLLAITNTGSEFRPEVKFYQGKEGLKAVYEDTLRSCEKGDEILNCLSVEGSYSILPNYIFRYMRKRVAKGVKKRAIGRDSAEIRKRKAKDKKELRHIKIVPKAQLPFTIEKNIFKDKVALMNFRGFLFGIIIKSPQIAESEKASFELLWKKLPDKPLTK